MVSHKAVVFGVIAVVLVAIGAGVYFLRAPLGLVSGSVAIAPSPSNPSPNAGGPQLPVPQPVAEIFEKWRVQCIQNAQSQEYCRAEQVVLGVDGVPQLAIIVSPPMAGRVAQAVIVPPWGLLIDRGLTVQVDAQPVFGVPILACLQTGCRAEFSIDAPLLGQLRQGMTLRIAMIRVDGAPVAISMPLAGFAAAYDRLLQKSGR